MDFPVGLPDLGLGPPSLIAPPIPPPRSSSGSMPLCAPPSTPKSLRVPLRLSPRRAQAPGPRLLPFPLWVLPAIPAVSDPGSPLLPRPRLARPPGSPSSSRPPARPLRAVNSNSRHAPRTPDFRPSSHVTRTLLRRPRASRPPSPGGPFGPGQAHSLAPGRLPLGPLRDLGD